MVIRSVCVYIHISSVQLLGRVQLFVTLQTAACQASLSITNSRSLLKLMSIESVMPSNYLILLSPLLLPSIFPSIRVFSNESVVCIRWPKYWSLSFNISHSNEYLGSLSFRMDWLDLLSVQGTLKHLLQYHSSKASILPCSAFFFYFLFVVNFVIHWNKTAMGLHVFPIPIPPPTSLSIRSPQVFPVHQVRALVSCIQPGLVICFTLDIIHVSMLFS